MEYKNISYFVTKWNIKERRIRVLCTEGRIHGVKKVGKSWLIPEDAQKPIDKRYRQVNDLFFDSIDFNIIDENKDIIDSHRPFSQNMTRQLRDKLIIEWTYNSNAIEGIHLPYQKQK